VALHQIMSTNKDFCDDEALMKSFNKLNKSTFLQEHPYIDEVEYNLTRAKSKYENPQIMNEDYSISIPFSNEELEEMLHENASFEWVFPTNENENVQITIHLHKEE